MPDPNKGPGGFDGANTPDPLPPATPGPGDGTPPAVTLTIVPPIREEWPVDVLGPLPPGADAFDNDNMLVPILAEPDAAKALTRALWGFGLSSSRRRYSRNLTDFHAKVVRWQTKGFNAEEIARGFANGPTAPAYPLETLVFLVGAQMNDFRDFDVMSVKPNVQKSYKPGIGLADVLTDELSRGNARTLDDSGIEKGRA